MPDEIFEFHGQRFDWDESKNIKNIEKHGIPFKEAATVFRDDCAVIIDDEIHSQDEERFKIIGFSGNARLLIVCHCYRSNENDEEIVRIFSAWKATQGENDIYGGNL